MNSKPFGDSNLKSSGLDGTWLPKGHFGESCITCTKCVKTMIHNVGVRPPHIVAMKNGSKANIEKIRPDCLATYDDIMTYKVNPFDGTVTFVCTCGNILGTYTPNPNFKHFDGELITLMDGQKIENVSPNKP